MWKSEIEKMDKGDSYRLSGMGGKKFVSTSKKNSTIERIGDVEEEKSDEESSMSDKRCGVQQNDVCVVAVVHLNSYNGCIKCNFKVIPDEEDTDLG